MNKMHLSIIFAMALLAFAGLSYADEDSRNKTFERVGPYFGQKPPGMIGERFAAGIIPVEGVQHCFPAFSPDGEEVFWMKADLSGEKPKGEIMFMTAANGKWTEPALAPFSGVYNDQAPFFSHDGNRLYFSSTRPGGIEDCKNIWYVDRTENGWSEPVYLGSPPNTELCATQATFTRDGTVYFVGRMGSVQWNSGIYRSKFIDGKYQEPEPLGDNINTEYADVYPFIAPDESFLLFGSTRPGAKSTETDLYIAFRNEEGFFEEPIHIKDEINKGSTVSFPFITHDGNYLMYETFGKDENGENTDLFYWIDVSVLDKYKQLSQKAPDSDKPGEKFIDK